jgi:hypothetical protein
MDIDKIDELQLEDVCLCKAWMEVRQNPICGAQQRGGTFGRRSTTASIRIRIWAIFIEKKNLGDTPFVSDRSEDSLRKRFAWIQEQTTKLNAAYDKIKNRKVGVLGVADMMTQYLAEDDQRAK